ncbi:MAG: hypothetical protein IT306_14675 [Chloroflexi bacterium]|nr:hypothetical protein [Chloroflexota bacterium]
MGWLPPLLPLPDDLEALRQQIANLPDDQRRLLLGRLHGDSIRRNDERHAQFAVEADRQRKGRRS